MVGKRTESRKSIILRHNRLQFETKALCGIPSYIYTLISTALINQTEVVGL